MACKRGKASPNRHVKLKLFASSGGYCQNPECNRNLFLEIGEDEIHIAEMAHIFSASNSGPRPNVKMSKEDRGKFENLILLCPSCHTIIDKAETQYPDTLIKTWKDLHSEKINTLFGIKQFDNRLEAKKAIKPYLNENRTVFLNYGPLTDERFNPESEMPLKWKAKIYSTILPNNRKILNMISQNYDLLKDEETIVFEIFKQHVQDFEDKHLNNNEVGGLQFPTDMNIIFDN